jgi:hypothetical protein
MTNASNDEYRECQVLFEVFVIREIRHYHPNFFSFAAI